MSDDISRLRTEYADLYHSSGLGTGVIPVLKIANIPLNIIPFVVDMDKSVDENLLTLTNEYSELRRQLGVLGWTDWVM